jgi:hypothetical protein
VATFAELVERIDRSVQARLGGEPVIYQPAVGAAVTVTGIFDPVYVLVKGDPEAGVETLGPVVFLRLEDLPVDPEDDDPTLTIRGVTYRHVVERLPDGFGGIVLALRTIA